MWIRQIFVGIVIVVCCFLLYFFRIRSPLPYISTINTNQLSFNYSEKNISTNHTAIILTRRPSVKVLKHLYALLNANINAFVMCDEEPTKYMKSTDRILYIGDENLAQYGLNRNRVWDRVFVWLYN